MQSVIKNFKSAQRFLDEYFYNDRKYIEYLQDLTKWPQSKIEFENLEKELSAFVLQAYTNLIIHEEDYKFNLSLRMSLECTLFYYLHDFIMPIVSAQCYDEDAHLYDKCLEFSNKNVTAEQFGAKEDYAIPLYAGIVELASLDNRKTPVEKIACLCTTYDLLYAELKSAIAEFLSETSDADNEIPIVENADMIPILMTVIVKSKLLHLYSNLYYINMFLWTCTDTENVNHVLTMFGTAIDQISRQTEATLRPSSAKNCKELDLKTTFEIMNEMDGDQTMRKSESLLDIQRRKIAEQIRMSTNS